jgi:hypothetical protein
VTLMRAAIWLATAFFVIMLFAPLLAEMAFRLSAASQSGLP